MMLMMMIMRKFDSQIKSAPAVSLGRAAQCRLEIMKMMTFILVLHDDHDDKIYQIFVLPAVNIEPPLRGG